MPNTSATGGYLQPTNTSPIHDQNLDIVLQDLVSGITGLPGNYVRPRWQPKSPQQLEREIDWCAVGVIRCTAEYGHHIEHNPDNQGSDLVQSFEKLEILATFYGPNSSSYASKLRDGLWIEQNREAIKSNGLHFVELRDIFLLGEAMVSEWRRRADLLFFLNRIIERSYPVLNILSSEIDLATQVADEIPDHQTIKVTEN